MRKPLIAGNWKMCLTPTKGGEIIKELCPLVAEAIKENKATVVICPAFVAIDRAIQAVNAQNSGIKIGAQNLYPQVEGAYTGEVAPNMLLDLGVSYVIVGHSERREYFNESDEFVSEKAAAILANSMIPIVCVGESQATRESGKTLEWIKSQILGSLAFWNGESEIVVAYEPIWAIGIGLTAINEDAEEVIAFIRQTMFEKWGKNAENIQILYGGSVKPATIKGLMAQPNIDGALVGGASLKAESFAGIVNF